MKKNYLPLSILAIFLFNFFIGTPFSQEGTASAQSSTSTSTVKTAPVSAEVRILKQGMKGGDVAVLQNFLEDKGFLNNVKASDKGYFGTLTVKALKKYQANAGIRTTGQFGPETRAKVEASIGKKILLDTVLPVKETTSQKTPKVLGVSTTTVSTSTKTPELTLNEKLAKLESDLRLEIARASANSAAISNSFATIAQANSLTSSISASGATLTNSNVSGTISGSISGSISGTSGSFSGNLSGTTAEFANSLSASSFSATSTVGTSTFAGNVSLSGASSTLSFANLWKFTPTSATTSEITVKDSAGNTVLIFDEN